MEFHYELCDDGGCNALYLPILLEIGTKFKHEFGTYIVEAIKNNVIICERISK